MKPRILKDRDGRYLCITWGTVPGGSETWAAGHGSTPAQAYAFWASLVMTLKALQP